MVQSRILIVEDQGIVAWDIRNCLENLGHTVCGTAASGEEAIRMTADLQPDLVLMDVMLEGDMDGVEAAAYIRKHFETPVVYLTAYADGNTLQRAKVTEPYGYIIKPFEEKEMYTVIEIALYRRSMESKLKKAQEERRQLEARVQYARKQESLIQVVSGIAHRFNNMLGAILGNTELALLELPPDSPVKYTVEQIGKVSLGARDLVRQMVAFTGRRLRTGQKFNLSELILGMRSSIEEAVSGREITVECDLVSPLPDIRGDMVQIRQALMNLIVNAVEAIGDGNGRIRVRTGLADAASVGGPGSESEEELEEGPHVVMEISDTGCGIAPEHMGRIFDPFYSTKFPGRGLGLAEVLGIVRSNSGAVRVTGEPGRGTVFGMFFPCLTEEDGEED